MASAQKCIGACELSIIALAFWVRTPIILSVMPFLCCICGGTWLECNTSDGEDTSERFVVVFPTSIVRAKHPDIISPAVHFGLKLLEGCRAGLRAFVREDGALRMMKVVINVDNEVLGTA